jgi:GT2 family glycosyltransferase
MSICQYDLTAAIVAYKTDLTEIKIAIDSCLSSTLHMQVIVVDNSASDELNTLCQACKVRYIRTAQNIGFGNAHNVALVNSLPSKYHLVLNPDVRFDQGVLEELYAFLELNDSVGLVMPRVLYPDGSPQNLCKRLPSPIDIFAKRLLSRRLQNLCRGRLDAFELLDMDMDKVLSVPYLSGCFMFLRSKALHDVGGFDERFFMYFEDLDLTRRIHRRYSTVYYPAKTIVHRHEKGSYKSTRLLFCGIRSAVKYFNKWGWVLDRERDAINRGIGPLENLQLPMEQGTMSGTAASRT